MKNRRFKLYCLTAVLTLCALLVMFYISGVWPFGDRMFLWADGDQYFAIEHYLGTVTGKNNLLYSWSMVLGGNIFPQFAYYSFSPFNLLYIPLHDHMIPAVHLVACLKIICASLAFCFCLEELYPEEGTCMKSLASVCYGLMGYMIYFGWNTSWMDGVILLPMMYTGIRRLIHSKGSGLYTASLSLALIANFYIGYMLCICSVILYISELVLSKDGFRARLKATFVQYACASVLSAGIAMAVLLPSFLGLPSGRAVNLFECIRDLRPLITLPTVLSGLFTGQVNTLSDNAPLIYMGAVPLFLAAVFFVCGRVPRREKLVYGGLLFILLISFQNPLLNIVWHGMSRNAWFNYRYSFFAGFVILRIACEGYRHAVKGDVTVREYAYAGAIPVLTAAFVMAFAKDHVRPAAVGADLIVIVMNAVIFCGGRSNRKPFAAVPATSILLCPVFNGVCYLNNEGLFSARTQEESFREMREASDSINDPSFYRMDKSFLYTRCDALLFDYRGVTNYASTENMENLAFAKRLGLNYGWLSGKYTEDMPEASESLLGIRYILSDAMHPRDYEVIGGTGAIRCYRNPHALPVLFPADTLLAGPEDTNDFELQNALWKSIDANAEDVFHANRIETKSDGDTVTVNVTVTYPGSVYIGIPWGSYTSVRTEGTASDRDLDYTSDRAVYYAGEFEEGDTFNLALIPGEDRYDPDNLSCFTEDKDAVAENAAKIHARGITITERSSSFLEVTYEGTEPFIATTIPYDRGWHVYDNGKNVRTVENWGNFLAFELPETTEHHIELKYVPPGFTAGAVCSGVSLILFVLSGVMYRRNRRTDRA